MKIGVCDDVQQERERTKEILLSSKLCSEGDVELFSPQDVLLDLEDGKFDCDIMIMDIEFEMDTLNGIQLSRGINLLHRDCKIIYLTNIIEFAPNVYETEHCYFVLKANKDIMLPLAVKKAKGLVEQLEKRAAVKVTTEGKTVFVRQQDIKYIEKIKRVTYIHTEDAVLPCYMSLVTLAKQTEKHLVRCHTGYLVNLDYIKQLRNKDLEMEDGTEIPVGRVYQESFKQAYLQYWMERV